MAAPEVKPRRWQRRSARFACGTSKKSEAECAWYPRRVHIAEMSLQYSRRIAVCEKYIAACVAAVHLIVSSSETLLVRFMPLNRRWRGSLWASNRTCRRRGGTIQVVKTWLLQNNFAFPNRTLGGLGSMTTPTNRTFSVKVKAKSTPTLSFDLLTLLLNSL